MPTVPRYGQRQVLTSPLPAARKTAAETDLSTGAGLEFERARTGQRVGDLSAQLGGLAAGVAGDIITRERKRADEAVALESENALSRWETKRLYDPEGGALTRKGKDSFGLPEEVLSEFDRVAGDIAATLSSDAQREAFAKVRLRRQVGLDLELRRHVFREMQAYEQAELQQYLENAVSSAITHAMDPRRAQEDIGNAVARLKTFGPDFGMGPEQIDAATNDLLAKAHVGIIDRLLANDAVRAAEVYFEEAKDQIPGEELAAVEKALEEGGLRQQAQRTADEILAAGGTLTEQREKARALDDPKLRDEVMQRLEHEATVREREEREAHEDRLRDTYDLIEETQSLRALQGSPAWRQMSGGERSAARRYLEDVAAGIPTQTDLGTYYRLMQLAGTKPDTFAETNLMAERGRLDKTDFKQLSNLQLQIRNGERSAADRELDGFRTRNQILDDTLTQYGLETRASEQSEEERVAVAQLRRMLDRRVEAFEAASEGKRKASPTDVQSMLDELLSMKETVPGSWWAILRPFKYDIADRETALINMTVGDIPAADRKAIEEGLRRAHLPVSDALILDVYLEQRTRAK